MEKRKIIKIDPEKCNGCAACIPNCPEGAIQIIDGKARLISDLFCDGLGACLGHCPQGAISIEEREAREYDEKKVMENIVPQGPNVIRAHLEHLKGHNQQKFLQEALDFLKEKKIKISLEPVGGTHAHQTGGSGCPGSRIMDLRKKNAIASARSVPRNDGVLAPIRQESTLENWPVQLTLVPAFAPFLEDTDLLIAADCLPFAYASFHQDLLEGKTLLVGCPKLDNLNAYQEKINQILKNNRIKSVTYAHMEVPCCFGLVPVIQQAISASGKKIPFHEVTISIKGERLSA